MKFILLLVTLLFAASAMPAQADVVSRRAKIDAFLDSLGGDAKNVDESKTIDWGVLPGPFYRPETSLGLGVALVGLYRPGHDHSTPMSSLTLMGYTSVTGLFGVAFKNYNYFDGDRWRIFANGSMYSLPDAYWGTGYEAGRHTHPQGYSAQAIKLWPKVYARIAPSTYLGLGWNLVQMHASDLEDGNNSMISQTADGPSVFSSGMSAHFLNDTRDFAENPARGHVLSVDYIAYSPVFASDERFNTLTTRWSNYVALDDKDILAFDMYGDFRDGDVPWNMLATLGGDERMRGYYVGRYRDRDTFSTQLEWRRQLAWRHGVTLWVGAGTLASTASDLGDHWLPNYGIGYRFMFKPRVNVRFDVGIGSGTVGTYFQVGEAF